MNGFEVYDKALKETVNKAGTFKILAQDEDLEIFESHIKTGRSIICQPYECEDSLNIALVISGKLYHTNTGRIIMSGERYMYKNLKETHHLSVVEDTKILMIRKKNLVERQLHLSNKVSDFLHKIQEKDQYTEDHCNRTGNLAVQIATHMKLSEEIVKNVLLVGKFHDVGKIDIPESILNKPGKLTMDEFDLMKKHPQVGHDIVIREMGDRQFARIVMEHHEKLDGSGYPKGLRGDEICIEAKVILVADSFDAMTSDRPYRKAMMVEDAIKELRKYAGVWYEVDIVEALSEIVDRTLL